MLLPPPLGHLPRINEDDVPLSVARSSLLELLRAHQELVVVGIKRVAAFAFAPDVIALPATFASVESRVFGEGAELGEVGIRGGDGGASVHAVLVPVEMDLQERRRYFGARGERERRDERRYRRPARHL